MKRCEYESRRVLLGLKTKDVSDALDLTPATLYRKVSGKTDLTAREIAKLRDLFKLTPKEVNDIFLTDV